MRPFVSVMIPVRQEAAAIGRCLASVLAASYPRERMEVIVADGLSRDGTRSIVAEAASQDARVHLIDNPGLTTPRALNRALAAARGDVILRVDAHSVIASGYVEELVGFLEAHPDAWGAGGRMRTVAGAPGRWGEAVGIALSHRFGVGNSAFRTDRAGDRAPYPADTVFNCAWRREVFEKVGDFNARLARSQDIEFSTRIRRAGGTLWLVPRAETIYFARTRALAFVAHNWTNGVWAVLPSAFLERTPLRLRHWIPVLFVVALLASFAAGRPAVIAAPYMLANLASSLTTAWRERTATLALLLPVVFSGLHLSYGCGSLWGALRVAAIVCKRRWHSEARPLSPSSL